MTALHVAAANGLVGWPTHVWSPVEKINMLLAKGAQVNLQDGWGRTALHYAARNGRSLWAGATADATMVNALRWAGADPSIKDGAGKTALDYAIAESYGTIADAIRAFTGDTTQKVFYYLLQIAYTLFQLLEKGSLFQKAFPHGLGSLKNIAARLLEAWRNLRLSPQAFTSLYSGRFQIRFDTS